MDEPKELVRRPPKSSAALLQQLEKAIGSQTLAVKVFDSHLEIDLDGMANFGGNPDVYLPLKRKQVSAATTLVKKIARDLSMGFAPSHSDVAQLFDMIDPHAG